MTSERHPVALSLLLVLHVALLVSCEPAPRPAARGLPTPEPLPISPPPARPPSPTSTSSSSSPVSRPAPTAPGVPALAGPAVVALPVEGYGAAVVSVPVGATAPRPVILATHGNYDRPEWQCEVWRGIVGDAAFVLCPRGVERPDSPGGGDVRFTYPDNRALERETVAALAALEARYPAHVDRGPRIWTGFSLGAIMGVAVATRGDGPARYPAMVLVEGGHDRWTAASAKVYAAGGGRRVLFACGQPGCMAAARTAAKHLERAGVATRIVGVKDAGHSYAGAVAGEVAAAWPWVLEGGPALRVTVGAGRAVWTSAAVSCVG